MSENRGGDVLARGERSAQFRAGVSELSEFEHDLAVGAENLRTKYGLSEAEIEHYQELRTSGERFDLKPVQAEELPSLVSNEDRWKSKVVPAKLKKFADRKYSDPTTILDRVLVKRVPEDPDKFEILQDGSLRDRDTGFVIPYAYRQHNNLGIVLKTGQFVILGGVKIPMEDVVRPGDRVKFGDYNSEVFTMDEKRVEELCDAVQMNFENDPEGLRVVRVQDIRTIERPVVEG